MTPEEIARLIRTVLRHENNIAVLLSIVSDFACLIEPTLARCSTEGCKAAATVRHAQFHIEKCDECAARVIVRARKNIQRNVVDDLNMARVALCDEDFWIDLTHAERIRRVCDYVQILAKDEVASMNTDPELH